VFQFQRDLEPCYQAWPVLFFLTLIFFMQNISNPLANFKYDIPASVVVFLVALPLCLGIALASGAPLMSGIIAGIVGGLVIGSLSGSNLSVSGPAAGLTTIVIAAIHDLGSYQAFLLAVIFGGMIQFVLGLCKAGSIGSFFPSAVIRGMLAAIGLILILKQIPHALGYDRDYEGDENFFQPDGENTFTGIFQAVNYLTPGAIAISLIAILILITWEKPSIRQHKFLQYVPGPLIAVLVGVILNIIFNQWIPFMTINEEHMVSLPVVHSLSDARQLITFPDFQAFQNPKIYMTAGTLALVASLESLLSIEAGDKLDQFKRITPLNRELRVQGIGNMVSGILGGLPITAVIVRTSANANAGARTKLSTIVHGGLLLFAVVVIPSVLNTIPLAALAGILLVTGYKLTKPALYKETFANGLSQFVPFIVTIVSILITNLLIGIFIGIATGLYFVLKTNFHSAITLVNHGNNYLIRLNKDVSFLNKAVLRKTFERIPRGAYLIIDGGNSQFIDADIVGTIADFKLSAASRDIQVEIKKSNVASHQFFNVNS
jgi:MFS superfamily sulfate permease-like transporter